jgi:hypothetical protein
LRNFGLKVGMVGAARFEARIKELVENLPDLGVLVEPLLIVRRTCEGTSRMSALGGKADIVRGRARSAAFPAYAGEPRSK